MSSARPAAPASRCAARCWPTAVPIVPVVRDAAKWARQRARIADLTDAARLRERCADADRIVCCAHARHAARGDRGSATGRALRLPRQHAQIHPLAGRARQRRAGGRGGVPRPPAAPASCCIPTMIYGAAGRGQCAAPRRPAAPAAGRAAAGRRPGAGAADPPGRRDARDPRRAGSRLARAARAGDRRPRRPAPTPISCAPSPRAAGLRRAAHRPASRRAADRAALPTALRYVPCLPRIRAAEIRRLLEDKAFRRAPDDRRRWAFGRSRCRKGLRAPSRAHSEDLEHDADHQPHRRVPSAR